MGNGGQRYVTHCVKLITHQEPIEGIPVWILLGCPSNILSSQTLPPGFPLPVGNFFNIHLTKIIMEHKRCRIRF